MKKILVLFLLITAGLGIGAGLLLIKHPGLITVLQLSNVIKTKIPQPEIDSIESGNNRIQVLNYRGNTRSTKRNAIVFYGLTHHAENHPALGKFIGALLPHYGAVYVPELPGMKSYNIQSGRTDVHQALRTLGDRLQDYDVYAFCVAGPFLTEALFNGPPVNLPRKAFLHSPFFDGGTITGHYRSAAMTDLDAGALLVLAANSEIFSTAERNEILQLLSLMPAGHVDQSHLEGRLNHNLWQRIILSRAGKSQFLQEYRFSRFIQRKLPIQFFILASRNDRVIPFREAEALCSALKHYTKCELHIGNAGSHTGVDGNGFISDFLHLADFFEMTLK